MAKIAQQTDTTTSRRAGIDASHGGKTQREFKTTPDYIELGRDMEVGYTMGVYLCLGQQIYETSHSAAVKFSDLKTFEAVHAACEAAGGRILVFLAQASHKIKKKAEQLACDSAIQFMP